MELLSSGEKEGLGYRITFELVGQSGTGVFVSSVSVKRGIQIILVGKLCPVVGLVSL